MDAREKPHMTGVMIDRPGTECQTLDILPFHQDHLDGISLIKIFKISKLEHFIISCHYDKNRELEGEMQKFILLPICPPVEVCRDRAGDNARARRICALRHPKVMFIPCFCSYFLIKMRIYYDYLSKRSFS